MNPKVDVLIAAHYNPLTIERAVRSARQGEFVRVIVADDGTDHTADLAKRAGADVLHLDPCGPAEALNAAYDHGSAPYVMHLDADDWLQAECLPHLIDALDNGAGFAYGCTKYWGLRSDMHRPPAFNADDFYTTFPSLYAILRKRDYGLHYEGMTEWENGIVIPMDWCMALQLIEAGHSGVALDEVLVLHYVLHAKGIHKTQKADPSKHIAAVKRLHPKFEAVSV